jgi:hypothetical protein
LAQPPPDGGLVAFPAPAHAEHSDVPACEFGVPQPPPTITGSAIDDVLFGTSANDVIHGGFPPEPRE